MTNPTLTNRETGKSLDLLHTQDDASTTKAGVEGSSVYYDDSGETYLYSLDVMENNELTGLASGIYLSNQSGYSNDPEVALYEWCQELMSLVNGNQGEGWDLDSTERGRTTRGVIETVGWQVNKGERHIAQWDVSFIRGEAIKGAEDTEPNAVSPSESWDLDDLDLGKMVSYREEKSQKWNEYKVAMPDDAGENIATTETGARRRCIISGEVVGESNRNTFDDSIRSKMGVDTTYTFNTGVPGHTLTVMPEEFDSTRTAGMTRYGEYRLVLREGQQKI